MVSKTVNTAAAVPESVPGAAAVPANEPADVKDREQNSHKERSVRKNFEKKLKTEARKRSQAARQIAIATRRPGRFPHASMGAIIWLTIVWVLLWGDPSTANFVSGFLLALFITTVAPFPATPFDGRFRPLGVLRLLVIFFVDIVRASILQASFILRGKKPNGAIIRVQLRSHSDFYLATVSGMTGLVPGSVVVDVHNATGTLYVHVFDTGLAGGIAGVYKTVLEQEERVLRAFASHDELVDAGYVPGSHPSAGRLPTPYAPDTGSSSVQDSVQLSAAFNGQAPSFSQIAGNELQGKFAGKRDAHSEPDKKCARDIGSESEDGSGMKAPHAGSGKGK